jgi:hypothetical protein
MLADGPVVARTLAAAPERPSGRPSLFPAGTYRSGVAGRLRDGVVLSRLGEETCRVSHWRWSELTALSLAGCLTAQPPAWAHFDACANEPTFHAMVTCGKLNRQTVCEANRNCSPDGNAIVAYAESLDQSVQRREMSEPEARRRWIEFRMTRSNEQRQAAQAAAAAARGVRAGYLHANRRLNDL